MLSTKILVLCILCICMTLVLSANNKPKHKPKSKPKPKPKPSTNTEPCDDIGTLLYDDLGCKASYSKNQTCPSKYNCGNKLKNNKKGCMFKGKHYAVGAKIPLQRTYPDCFYGVCSCKRVKNKVTVSCSGSLYCDKLGEIPLLKNNCRYTHRPGECCASGQVCPYESNTVTKCTVDGKEYLEGDRFYPKDTCMECVCMKGFYNGRYEAPFCKRESCTTQIWHADKLAKNCAPVRTQRGKAKCCDAFWVCPEKNDIIFPGRSNPADMPPRIRNKIPFCHWGKKKMYFGSTVKKVTVDGYGKKVKVHCYCRLPPLMTCEQEW